MRQRGAYQAGVAFLMLLCPLVGCGTEQIYIEQDSWLQAGDPVGRGHFTFVIIRAEAVHADGSASLMTFDYSCQGPELIGVERFVLHDGESYLTKRHEATITQLAVDPEGGKVKLRCSQYAEIRRGFWPREPLPGEKPPPVDR
ncbi:MAG: hypothetical protein GC159_19905 [Phycisphaera sp.]|nr:hypothetical protein [Phycisphaera sp.]